MRAWKDGTGIGMPIDLAALFRPGVAVITSECQRGVLGPDGPLPALVETVRESGIIPNGARVLEAARAAGVPVLHGTVVRREDGGGVTMNCRLLTTAAASGAPPLLAGSDHAKVIEEFGPGELDYEVSRYHGVSLFHDTELDSILRSLGVRTVVLLGASLNIAILGSTIEAVNLGYQVVIPRDGVIGIPVEYGEAVLQNSMKMLATVTTCDEVVAALGAAQAS